METVIQILDDDLLIKQDKKTKLYGYENEKGEEIIPCMYSSAEHFSEGLALVGIKKKEGENSFFQQFYINTDGKVAIPYEKTNSYRYLWGFVEGRALVYSKDGKFGFIDRVGNLVVPCIYRHTSDYSEGLTPVTIGEKKLYGFINLDGELVIPYKFKFADDFSSGLALVQDQETHLWGYINKSGEIAIPCQYEWAECFEGSFALVLDEHRYGYINTRGKKILPKKYGRVVEYFEGTGLYNGLDIGYWTKTGEKVFVKKYAIDGSSTFCEGFITFDLSKPKDNRYTFCDLEGNSVVASSELELEINVLEMYKALIKKSRKVKKKI